MEIAVVKNRIGNIGIHKIDGNKAAIGKQRAAHLQRIELGIIQYAFLKLKLKQQGINHGEVYARKVAARKCHIAQGNIIDLSLGKIAVDEHAVDKRYGKVIALGKVAVSKRAALKVAVHYFVFGIYFMAEFLCDDVIGRHGIGFKRGKYREKSLDNR